MPSPQGQALLAASAPGGESERRYVLTRLSAEALLARIAPRLRLELHDPQRPVAYTRTTYLDTADRAYHKTSTAAVRRRIRVREYASALTVSDPALLTGVCAVELKEATGAARSKARFVSTPDVVRRLVGGADIGETSAVLDVLRRCLTEDALGPVVTTWYRRASLISDDARVRVTLDEGIRYARPVTVGEAGQVAEPPQHLGFGPTRVVEVKHLGEAPAWLDEALTGLEEAPRFSKFRAAMEALDQGTFAAGPSTKPIDLAALQRRKSGDEG